jgi:hypothetical protein
MLEFIEEALDEIALAVEPFVEGWQVDPVGHEFDIGPRAAFSEVKPQGVGVIDAVGSRTSPRPSELNMSWALRPSWAWPSVILRAMGSPQASTKTWILVVNPPRKRPMLRDRAAFFDHWRRADAPGSRTGFFAKNAGLYEFIQATVTGANPNRA